jgi:hypothetical protein
MPLDVDSCPFMPVPKKVIYLNLINLHRLIAYKEFLLSHFHVETPILWHYLEMGMFMLGVRQHMAN